MGVNQHLIAVLNYIDFSLVILSIFASAYQTFVFPVPEIAYPYLLSISLLGDLSFIFTWRSSLYIQISKLELLCALQISFPVGGMFF